MRIAYAGQAGTPHTQAYLRFLAELGEATFIAIDGLGEADLDGFDLLIVDAADWQYPQPVGVTRDRLRLPTVLVGNHGVHLADQLQLKFGSNYGCMCLKQEAIVWDPAHPVFAGLGGDVATVATPEHFRRFSAVLPVAATLPVLRVLAEDIGVEGQATAGLGFLDSPDCEIIAGGFNEKTAAHFAIARQGRFLHWGFSGSPEQYTEAGRRLLANCLRYLPGFAEDPVRVSRTTPSRGILRFTLGLEGWRGVGLPAEMQMPMAQRFLQKLFAMPVPAATFGERVERLAWFDAHADFLRNDGAGWYLDADAQALGLAIDDPALLDACLANPDERAGQLWQRYTGRPAADLERERAWLAHHHRHLYFTDWGGYRWVSLLEPAQPIPPAAAPASAEAIATLGVARYGEAIKGMVLLEIPPGFHAYAPGSDEGLPLSLTIGEGFELLGEPRLEAREGRISGQAAMLFDARGDGERLSLSLRLQLCDSLTCLMPQTLELHSAIAAGS